MCLARPDLYREFAVPNEDVKVVQELLARRKTERALTKGLCITCLKHAVSIPEGHEGGCAVFDRT